MLVQQIYAQMFGQLAPSSDVDQAVVEEAKVITQEMDAIDARIREFAPKYPLDQVAKTDLAILRVAVYELTVKKTEPTKVIINEAVDLAKEMGSERAFAFVNAVLGAIVQSKEHVLTDPHTST
jgi:N utilization substance protein B